MALRALTKNSVQLFRRRGDPELADAAQSAPRALRAMRTRKAAPPAPTAAAAADAAALRNVTRLRERYAFWGVWTNERAAAARARCAASRPQLLCAIRPSGGGELLDVGTVAVRAASSEAEEALAALGEASESEALAALVRANARLYRLKAMYDELKATQEPHTKKFVE